MRQRIHYHRPVPNFQVDIFHYTLTTHHTYILRIGNLVRMG